MAVVRPDDIPVLEGEAAAAVAHRGSHVQIVACAGSGKTEVVAQRVAALVAEGEAASSIVAFTFTTAAADELHSRIHQRAVALGVPDRTVSAVSVGTIHGFAHQLLRRHVEGYAAYEVVDDNRLAALLSREHYRLGLDAFVGKPYEVIRD